MRRTTLVVLCLCVGTPNAVRAQEEGAPVPVAPVRVTDAPSPDADAPSPEGPAEAEAEELAPSLPEESPPVAEETARRAIDELDDVETPQRSRAETDEEEPPVGEELPEPPQEIFLHGFRLGYLYVNDIESPLDPRDPSGQRYWERYDMRAPHLFMIGYEATVRMIGYDWLNVILTGNLLIAGLEQSRFFPSLNLIVGFEALQIAQLGIGISITPTKEEPAHMVIAAGFTPRVGSFYIPLHAFFVPDMNGHHKFGVTVGVNFF